MTPHPMLKTFSFCPGCGSSQISKTLKSVRCASCGLECFLNPVAAVAAIVEDASGRILLLKRAKEPSKGMLGFPGGFADVMESPEDALRREVMEECAIRLNEISYIGGWPNLYLYGGVEYSTLDIYYHAKVESIAAAMPMDETESCMPLEPEDIHPELLAFDSARHALSAYLSRTIDG